jgi:hypothetical protein
MTQVHNIRNLFFEEGENIFKLFLICFFKLSINFIGILNQKIGRYTSFFAFEEISNL